MIFSGADWTTVISEGAGVLVIVGTTWKWLKKHDPKLIKDIPHDFVTVADDAAHWIAGIAKSPWFASEAATGKIELHHITDKLLSAHVGTASADAIASFGKDFASMTEGEKGTAIEMVQAALKAFGQTVTAPQSIDALNKADARKAVLTPTANAATERSLALSAPKEQTSPVGDGQAPAAAVS